MKEISREELFELVWRKPMTKLAGEFGLSDQGLSKICARHAIPKPPRGYWAKLEAGKEVQINELPPCPAGTASIIRFTQSGQFQRKSRESTRCLEQAAVNVGKIPIPVTLCNLHPIVAAWVDEHREEQVERRARFRARQPHDLWWGEEKLADLTERDLYRFRVTSALLKGFEAEGGRALEGGIRGKLRLEASEEKFEIAVVEKMYQFHGRPSDEPKDWTAYRYHHNSALAPTGFLRFTITTYLGTGVKKEWVESSKLNGEDLLPTVIAGLLQAGPALAARRAEFAERDRRIEEERIAEERRRLLAQLEQEQWRLFRDRAKDWEEAQRLRSFLAALEANPHSLAEEIDGMPAADWMKWAHRKVEELDPLV
ncbi:hypothetical protein [Ruegeria sp. HKCCSA071]|uniref:hypothetical protein n=1 Tax=Ruegeria sp. HKCCSA071 TaxID=2794834 RepID=UPI001AE89334|nr:hypothetical protein [Ruegeria sp. HKCCSA071]